MLSQEVLSVGVTLWKECVIYCFRENEVTCLCKNLIRQNNAKHIYLHCEFCVTWPGFGLAEKLPRVKSCNVNFSSAVYECETWPTYTENMNEMNVNL